MYLLDTCVVSEARRRSPQAVAWLRAAQPDTLFLSALTIGEIMKGVAMKQRSDPRVADILRRWLDELRFIYGDRILPVDAAVATTWGRLMGQRTRPAIDALILATALVNNKTVVTRNVADFSESSVEVIDPWAIGR
jgi:predicted nucleic acid-binding protein